MPHATRSCHQQPPSTVWCGGTRLRIPDQISLLGFDDVGELRRLGISRVPYRPRDAALYAFDKIQEYHDPARKTHAHHDHLWQISYADADWNIATYEEPGTIKDIHDRGTTAEWDH